MFHVLIFTNGDYEKCKAFHDCALAQMFSAGVQTGADMFGGDDCAVFVMPDEGALLDEWVGASGARARERDRALAKIAESVRA